MSNDLDRILTDLEEVTARMIPTPCWERTGEFDELSASRRRLADQLSGRQDLDASASERIRVVIEAGSGLVARVMSMRESILTAGALIDRQWRFTREVGLSVSGRQEAHHLDIKV
jgi:hypothetical protein